MYTRQNILIASKDLLFFLEKKCLCVWSRSTKRWPLRISVCKNYIFDGVVCLFICYYFFRYQRKICIAHDASAIRFNCSNIIRMTNNAKSQTNVCIKFVFQTQSAIYDWIAAIYDILFLNHNKSDFSCVFFSLKNKKKKNIEINKTLNRSRNDDISKRTITRNKI